MSICTKVSAHSIEILMEGGKPVPRIYLQQSTNKIAKRAPVELLFFYLLLRHVFLERIVLDDVLELCIVEVALRGGCRYSGCTFKLFLCFQGIWTFACKSVLVKLKDESRRDVLPGVGLWFLLKNLFVCFALSSISSQGCPCISTILQS